MEKLSCDDELQGESNSISNQKTIFEEYASKNDLDNNIHFTDYGTKEQVNIGNIGTVIVKEMSCIGCDYLKVGGFKEIISIEKGIDDEKVLDSIYNVYLNSPCSLLNDMFDEMLI